MAWTRSWGTVRRTRSKRIDERDPASTSVSLLFATLASLAFAPSEPRRRRLDLRISHVPRTPFRAIPRTSTQVDGQRLRPTRVAALGSWHLFYERPCLGCASSSSMSDKAFGRAEADGGRGKQNRRILKVVGGFSLDGVLSSRPSVQETRLDRSSRSLLL